MFDFICFCYIKYVIAESFRFTVAFGSLVQWVFHRIRKMKIFPTMHMLPILQTNILLWIENGSFVEFVLRMPHLKSHLTAAVHDAEVLVTCNDNNH
jgi:hypothetical protein